MVDSEARLAPRPDRSGVGKHRLVLLAELAADEYRCGFSTVRIGFCQAYDKPANAD